MFKVNLWSLPLLMLLPSGALFYSFTESLAASTHRQVEGDLDAAAATVGILLTQESNRLVELASQAALEPDLRAAVMEAQAPKAAVDKAVEHLAAALSGAKTGSGRFFVVLAKDGRALYRTDRPERRNDHFDGLSLVAEGLSGVSRDGVWLLGETYHRVAIAPVVDKSVTVGAVLLADPVGAQDADSLSSQSHVAVALMAGNKVMGNALGSLEGVRVEGSPTPFGKAERPQDPLPLLHGDEGQWYGKALPVVDAWPSLKVVVAVPYAPAFASLAEFQLWSLAMGLLGFILAVLWTLLIGRTVDAPLRRIVDHLSAFNQGQNEGMLPEGAMSGPYVRLAKLINMVLEKRNPAVMAAAAPPMRGGASLDSVLSAPPPPPPAGGGPRNFDLDAASNPRNASPPASPAAPMQGGLGDLFSDAPTAAVNVPTDDPFAAFGRPTSNPPAMPPPPPPQQPMFMAPAPTVVASAQPTVIAPPPQPPQRSMPPPPPPHGFGGEPPLRQEATVMMQIPQELLDATVQPQVSRPPPPAARPSPSIPSMPAVSAPPRGAPPPPPPSEATVMVQVPQELLARSGMDEEEAHFRDIYQQFVRTREQCGEPADDLTYDRFVAKLQKNKQQLVQKYGCRTVRFQVYVKEGKAALKAVPVRE